MSPESHEAADLIAYLHRSRDELDKLRVQMAAERHVLEQERTKLREEWVGRQKKRIEQLENNFADMQKRFEANVTAIVEGVKDRELRAQLTKSTARKMRDVRGEAKDELNAALVQTISESQKDLGGRPDSSDAVNAGELQPGTKIHVRGFSKPVIFRRLDGSSAEIEAGPLRMKIAIEEITGVEGSAPGKVAIQPSKRDNITVTSQPKEQAGAAEINVIGMTVEQASELVDKFLDEAVLAGRSRIRIIHGHGTGALRRGLGEFLRTHPSVSQSAFETEDHGGKAITVVELRL
jgi:DNA mismatch repair protein MutS2